MVSKAKSIKGSVQSIEYIQNDKSLGDAIELDRNGIISKEANEIMKEFRLIQEANSKCEKNCISIVISPSSEKSFNLSELRDIGREHLKGLGLENNQYLMTLHQSTGKPHIHIIANRIDSTGKSVNDSFISLKSQSISENIAQKKGLITAKEWKKINEISIKPIKEEIKKTHQLSLQNSKTYDEYLDFMKSKGIKVEPTFNKNNELQGMKFFHKQSEITFKSSDIGKDFGVKNLIQNGLEMPKLSPPLQQIALKVMEKLAQQTVKKGFGIGY